jgi:hypothetical protein
MSGQATVDFRALSDRRRCCVAYLVERHRDMILKYVKWAMTAKWSR